MKLFLSLFFIGIILGNSGFSFLHVANHEGMGMNGYSPCLAAELQGMGACADAPETTGFVLFHLDAIAGLFLGVIDALFAVLLVAVAATLLFLSVARGESLSFSRILSRFLFARRDGYSFDFFHIKQLLLRALALHENSPSFS
jgi:hypothetical protein